MEITFERIEQYWGKDAAWVSEFEVTSDFNLHIERVSGGRFLVYQKSVADGEYDIVDGLRKDHKAVIDLDFTALVYPKYIKVVSEAEVTYAEVVSDGEIGTGGTGGNGGGENDKELKRNDVNFFDYDGTLLYAYSWEEAKGLTELPALPEHDGLEVREWNYTLDDIKAQGTETSIGKADVGACVYDSEGEQVLGDFIFIIPRGVEYFDSPIYGTAVTVLSIPNTVIEGGSQRISYCNIFGEVKIPISFVRTGADAYSFIVNCKVDSIYINGEKTYSDGYYYRIVFREIYRSQSTFAEEGTIGTSINSNYIKIHPSVNPQPDGHWRSGRWSLRVLSIWLRK